MRAAWAAVLLTAQAPLAARVAFRLLATARGVRVFRAPDGAQSERLTVIVPTLDERARLAPCLDGLLAHGPALAEIVVVDGGSTDGTPDLIRQFAARDRRVRFVDASPVPADWNGKAWGLQVGLAQATADWVLTMDADVRPAATLAPSLLAHARRENVDALSVATTQILGDWTEGLVHPAMLTSLVYRFGIPGHATRRVDQAQANGQCFLARRALLVATDAIREARTSRCEDVTIARALTRRGHAVGFYEAPGLVSVRMYGDGAAAWRNWPRSLPLRDRYWGLAGIVGLLEVTFVQALPLVALALLAIVPTRGRQATRLLRQVNVILLAVRLGVLVGTARAYAGRPWSYWLSPLLDMPVALRLWQSALQRRHVWRGRPLASG